MRSWSLTRRNLRGAAAAIVATAGLLGPVLPAAAQEADDRQPPQTLADFVHFVRIGRFDVAGGLAGELAALPISDAEFVGLVDDSGEGDRFDQAIAQALRVPELEASAAALAKRYRDGRLELARNPDEVARNIGLLTKGLLGRQRARERLLFAGEYAMPQLMEALLQNTDLQLKTEVELVMVDMRSQAVAPLVTALPELDPGEQQLVVSILDRIGYRQALPALVELRDSTTVAVLRSAAERVADRLAGGAQVGDAAALFVDLAEVYYDERAEVTSFPGEEFQLLWRWDDGLGLVLREVRTEVYHEAMAMRYAERSLRLDPASGDALALWVAANISREIDSPEGYANPAYPAERREADYYAVAAGPAIGQQVLGRALADGDAPLARRAIAAIAGTAGVTALLSGDAGAVSPLVSALTFPSRRVQFDAALAVAVSQPADFFPGAEQVVPTLASMIRDAGTRYAAILTGANREEYDRLATFAAAQRFRVLPPADGGLRDLAQPLADIGAADLVIISATAARAREVFDEARATPAMQVAPVVMLLPADEVPTLRPQFATDSTVALRRASITNDELAATITSVIGAASGGPIDDAEASAYTARSLAALRDLALARSRVLDAAEALTPLTEALKALVGPTRLDVADVLALIAEPAAQAAITDAALDASGGDQVALLGRVAVSARRHGRQISDVQARRLLELVLNERNPSAATAAATAAGALGLSGSEIVPLILDDASLGQNAQAGGR